MSEVQEPGTSRKLKPNRFRITSVIIVFAFVCPLLFMVTPSSISAETPNGHSQNKASISTIDVIHYGGLTGYIGDPRYAYMTNSQFNFTTYSGYWSITSTDGIAEATLGISQIQTNGTNAFGTSTFAPGISKVGYFRAFSDALGTGMEYQLMGWPSTGAKLNTSYYWRVYEGEKFLTHWIEVRNENAFNVNITRTQIVFANSYGGGIKVGDSATMQIWTPQQATAYTMWTTISQNAFQQSRLGSKIPAAVITSSTSIKAVTLGLLTERMQGFSANFYTGVSTYGIFTTELQGLSEDSVYFNQKIRISEDQNITLDKWFFGFSDSNDISDCLDDYVRGILAFNNLLSETKPVPDETLIWSSWPTYPHNVTDANLRDVVDYITVNDLPINWILVDDGWQSNDLTINKKDTLAMEVNTTSFPDMADTIAYIHSKGIKVMLWVDPGMMWFDGAVNATHPEWRLKTNASVLKVNSPVWGNAWYADPSNPAYLEYLTDQLIAMHTTWAIDGVKLDFQPSLREDDKGWNYNISNTQVDYAYENAILNGTANLDIVLNCGGFAGLSVNPLQFYASNAFRIGPDANVWTGIKSAIQNYSVPYFLLTSGPNAGELPLFDLDSVEPSFYWVYTNPINEVKVRADLIYALGGLREVSFAPINNASFFATVKPMMDHGTVARHGRFVEGQTGTIHNSVPNVFGRFLGNFSPTEIPDATIALVNWEATSSTRSLVASAVGGGVANLVLFEANRTFFGIGSSISMLISSRDSCLFHLYSGTSVTINSDAYWNPVDSTVAIWNLAGNTPVTFTLSGLESGRMYYVNVDGDRVHLLQATGSGTISFTYSGPWSEHTFEVVAMYSLSKDMTAFSIGFLGIAIVMVLLMLLLMMYEKVKKSV